MQKLRYSKLIDIDEYNEDYNNVGKYNLIYNLIYSTSDIFNGKCVEHYSEYNDESGNDIYESYDCSCLLIWK